MLSPGRRHTVAVSALFAALVLFALASTAATSYGSTPITDYNCPNDNSNNGHYVPANRYWEQEFTAQGTSIAGGYLLLGANEDGGDHIAKIGIYTGADRSGALAEIEQQVVGYGGVTFSFPTPIAVRPGQQLHIAATGIGDFTAYDERPSNGEEGCFIGRIEGYLGSASEESSPHGEPSPPPQETASSEAPTSPSPQPSGSPAVAHFSRTGAVKWANEHVHSPPPSLFKNEDCTDFISQAWLHGGKLGEQFPWWYFVEDAPFQELYITYSPNWGAAENFANAMTKHHWVSRADISNMNAPIVPGAQPGDVILWHQNDGADTYWSHVALVVGTEHGATVIDQHAQPKKHTTWDEAWQKASGEEKHILRAQLLHVLN
jgi:hypothetical protein